MKGWLVTNGFLRSDKFSEIYAFLAKSASEEGMELTLKTSSAFSCTLDEEIFTDGKPDFVIFWDKDYHLASRLQGAGVRLFNNADGIRYCDDKALTALLVQGKLPMPKTVIAPKTFDGVEYSDRDFLCRASQTLGYPMVVKESFGSFGQQVYLAQDGAELNKIVDNLKAKPFIMQEFIESSKGRDVRVNVVGGRVFCAILRENKNDFRSNISGGGMATEYVPTPAQAELAIRACKLLGLDFGGVDVLFGENEEPLLCEVNSNPHFKSTYDCTGKDMSVAIMRHIKECLL